MVVKLVPSSFSEYRRRSEKCMGIQTVINRCLPLSLGNQKPSVGRHQ